MKNYYCIDCFCGAGGLALGLHRAGFKLKYSFDIDPKAIATMHANENYFGPHIAEVKDIYEISPLTLLAQLKLKPGEVDLLAGGPPCQGFSIQRVGNDIDSRNNLVTRYIEVVKSIRPKFFIMENVPGITGKRGALLLNEALTNIAKEGYFIHQKTLDAQHFNVPQRRKRVIIIGERKDHDSPLFSYPQPNEQTLTVRDTIERLPAPPDDYTNHPNILT